jgi:glucans biosynthesis protein C
MDQQNLQSLGSGNSIRLSFIDNLRTCLVVLVVLHHIALVYGAGAPFYYVEPPTNSPGAFLSLLVFILANQSWFMGAFFLLAGYFVPRSFDKKGAGPFVKGRLLRFGIPIVIFYFVLNPVSSIGYYLMPAALTGITTPLSWQAYPYFLGLGPLWFVALLLIFTLGYALWRVLTKERKTSSPGTSSSPGYSGIIIFILALALAGYLIRMVIPLGKTVLQFPTLAYLPQYLSFFILGTVAYRRDWFRTLPGSKGLIGFAAAAAAGVFLFPLAFSGRLFSLELTPALGSAFGNGLWQSAVYSLWDSITAVGMCLGLITLFRRFANGQGRFVRLLSEQGYTVYIIHIPIIVFLSYMLRGAPLGSLLKFGFAAVIIIPVCFAAAFVIRKITPDRIIPF